MRERDCFGEKMTDLDFRIDARLEAAKELDHIVRSDENGRIRLLRIDGAHVLYGNLPFVRKPRRRGELDSTLVGFDGVRGAQGQARLFARSPARLQGWRDPGRSRRKSHA